MKTNLIAFIDYYGLALNAFMAVLSVLMFLYFVEGIILPTRLVVRVAYNAFKGAVFFHYVIPLIRTLFK